MEQKIVEFCRDYLDIVVRVPTPKYCCKDYFYAAVQGDGVFPAELRNIAISIQFGKKHKRDRKDPYVGNIRPRLVALREKRWNMLMGRWMKRYPVY